MKGVQVDRKSKEGEVLGHRGQSIPGWGMEGHKVGKGFVIVTSDGIETKGNPSVIINTANYSTQVEPPATFERLGSHSDLYELPLIPGMTVEITLPHDEHAGRNGVASIEIRPTATE
jgi:hypothetical protein